MQIKALVHWFVKLSHTNGSWLLGGKDEKQIEQAPPNSHGPLVQQGTRKYFKFRHLLFTNALQVCSFQ